MRARNDSKCLSSSIHPMGNIRQMLPQHTGSIIDSQMRPSVTLKLHIWCPKHAWERIQCAEIASWRFQALSAWWFNSLNLALSHLFITPILRTISNCSPFPPLRFFYCPYIIFLYLLHFGFYEHYFGKSNEANFTGVQLIPLILCTFSRHIFGT